MSRWLIASSQSEIEYKASEIEGKKIRFVDTTNPDMKSLKGKEGTFHYNSHYGNVELGFMQTSTVRDLEISGNNIYITTRNSKYFVQLVNDNTESTDDKSVERKQNKSVNSPIEQAHEYLNNIEHKVDKGYFSFTEVDKEVLNKLINLILNHPEILRDSKIEDFIINKDDRVARPLIVNLINKHVIADIVPDYIFETLDKRDLVELVFSCSRVKKSGDKISAERKEWVKRLKNFIPEDYTLMFKNQLFTKPLSPSDSNHWLSYHPKKEEAFHYPWKIHLYADSFKDWLKLSNLTKPVLDKYPTMNWKMAKFGDADGLQLRNDQKGKAIVLYPENKKQFEQVAQELDQVYKDNNFTRDDTEIRGDRALGTTGRIFYRYEYKSGKDKDVLLDLNKYYDDYVNKYYDANRGGDRYLASDMSPEDDPFLHLLEE